LSCRRGFIIQKQQHPLIPLAKPDIGQAEKNAVLETLDSSVLSRGPRLQRFESMFRDYTGSQYAIGLSSGTAALQCSMLALGLGTELGSGLDHQSNIAETQRKQIITTPFTVPATINPILAINAEPVLVDIDRATQSLTVNAVEQARTEHTKAVIAVYPFGQPIHIEPLKGYCEQHQLILIEDSCEALGTHINGQHAGTFGQAGCFGFYPNKQITTGEGGMCITDDIDVAKQLRLLINHGRAMDGSWLDQLQSGHNFRLSELQAAVGVAQMQRIEQILSDRRHAALVYDQLLADEPRISAPDNQDKRDVTSLFCYNIQLNLPGLTDENRKTRDQIVSAMADHGIQCGRYFAPLHHQSFWQKQLKPQESKFPVCEDIAARSITLPFFTSITEAQQTRVIDCLTRLLHQLP